MNTVVVIPTYNEKGNIAELVRRVRAVLPDTDLFFVDDNSPDGTAAEIQRLAAGDSHIHLWQRPGRLGLGSAYRQAFEKILQDGKAQAIVTMDADLSHPPEALADIIGLLDRYDVVVGSRYSARGGVSGWSTWRHALSRAGNWYARLWTDGDVADSTAGYVGYTASALRRIDISGISSDGYSFQIEIKHRLAQCGARVCEHPIVFSERREGQSKLSWKIIREAVRIPPALWYAAHKATFWSAVGLGIGMFFLYAATAPSTIYLFDNAEYIAAASVLGVPHPTGYPLYVLLAHVFALMPFGTVAYRVNVFSAFCASAGLVFFFLFSQTCMSGLFRRKNIRPAYALVFSLMTAVLLGISTIFWAQSNLAETYALNFLFTAAELFFVSRYWQNLRPGLFFLASFLYGLSLANHQMMLLILPVFLLAFWYGKKLSWRQWVVGGLLFSLGLSAYGLLFWFSSRHPALDWGHIQNMKQFINHIDRKYYQDYGSAVRPTEAVKFIGDFFLMLWQQFGWLLLAVPLGLFAGFVHIRRLTVLAVGILLGNTLGIVLVRNVAFTAEATAIYRRYYLPAYAVTALFCGLGLAWLCALLARKIKYAAIGVCIAFAVCLAVIGAGSYRDNNLRDLRFVDSYSRSLLASLKPNAVLLLSYDGSVEDHIPFAIMYQQVVEKFRPDVTVLGYPTIFAGNTDSHFIKEYAAIHDIASQRLFGVRFMLDRPEYKTRPLYTGFPFDAGSLRTGLQSYSNGFAYELAVARPADVFGQPLVMSAQDKKAITATPDGRDVFARYQLAQAGLLLAGRQYSESQNMFVAAIENSIDPANADIQAYRIMRSQLWKK